jgi:hypothetical protein
MTEAEWLACDDSRRMLVYLDGKVSQRKRSLTECAFLRRFWDLLPDERSRKAIEAAEQYADGAVSSEELVRARAAARQAFHAAERQEREKGASIGPFYSGYLRAAQHAAAAMPMPPPGWPPRMIGLDAIASAAQPIWYRPAAARDWPPAEGAPGPVSLDRYQEILALRWGDEAFRQARLDALIAERAAQAAILLEIFGNPFRPVPVDPRWRAWERGTIPRLARVLYDERRFADLPVLADALEDAGCADADILSHCRAGGPHVRGCWAVDLLLGKR